MVKCSLMKVKFSFMSIWSYTHFIDYHFIIPSFTSILLLLAWSKPSFAHLTINEKLRRLQYQTNVHCVSLQVEIFMKTLLHDKIVFIVIIFFYVGIMKWHFEKIDFEKLWSYHVLRVVWGWEFTLKIWYDQSFLSLTNMYAFETKK